MKKITKILLIILGLVVLSAVLHFSPTMDQLLTRIPFVQEYYQNTALTVTTRRAPANVSIDGRDYGQTPVTITTLPEGKYLVEIERISDTPELYEKQQFYINLYRKTESIINVEIAPEHFKSGYILYYTPTQRYFASNGYLTVHSELSNYQIFLDEQLINQGDLTSHELKPGEYDLRIESSSYESVEFPVIIREGYNLNATIYLLPIPMIFN